VLRAGHDGPCDETDEKTDNDGPDNVQHKLLSRAGLPLSVFYRAPKSIALPPRVPKAVDSPAKIHTFHPMTVNYRARLLLLAVSIMTMSGCAAYEENAMAGAAVDIPDQTPLSEEPPVMTAPTPPPAAANARQLPAQ
jgi:hypothetical protein